LLTCYRYIELDPVRAGMVAGTGQYRWSSYRANGLGQADTRLMIHPLYPCPKSRRTAYRALFRPLLDTEAAVDIRQALRLGMPVGQGRFAEEVCAKKGESGSTPASAADRKANRHTRSRRCLSKEILDSERRKK
jgi:putative transposase